MPNLTTRSAQWLSDRLTAVASRAVSYRQGVQFVLAISGVPSEESYKVSSGEGVFTWVHTTDWTFAVADLDGVVPRPGDRIHETLGTEQRIYEVHPISDDEPCTKQLDTGNVMIVVHTKRIQ